MSKNNSIRKSDKKFIRKEKARIRREFSDAKKQEEMINELYKRFTKTGVTAGEKEAVQATAEVKKEIKKEAKKVEEKPKKITAKKTAPKKAVVK